MHLNMLTFFIVFLYLTLSEFEQTFSRGHFKLAHVCNGLSVLLQLLGTSQ